MSISLDGQIFLVEITGCINSSGATQTFYFCGGAGGFITSPTDTPANQFYEPRVLQPADFTRPMFSDVTTGGSTTVSWGTLDLENTDGVLDYFMNYAFDNRLVRILVGDPLAPYSTFNVVMQCTVHVVQYNYNAVHFTLRDLQASLALQLITHLYGGTNILPAGIDGTTDIIGKPVPQLYGAVVNIQPICVNTSLLTYQINDGAVNSIQGVYDQGLPLTVGTNYATVALLHGASTAAAHYDTCLAFGYFRLGSSPVGPVTCDAKTGAAIANRTPAQLIKQVATVMGFGSSINAADVVALDAVATTECGVWISDTSSALAAIDQLSACCGAYVGFDNTSTLRMAQLQVPSGTPDLYLDFSQIKSIDIVSTNDAQNGIPVYAVDVTYAPNYTVMTSGIAGSVTQLRRTILGEAFLTASAANSAVLIQYLSSQRMSRTTCLLTKADADAEAARLLALYAVQRYTFQVTVKLDTVVINSLILDMLIEVTVTRFGMDFGKLLRLIQIEADYATTTAILTLWC